MFNKNTPPTPYMYAVLPQGYSAARRIRLIKNPNDPATSRTHNLLACSTEPQPSAPICKHQNVLFNSKMFQQINDKLVFFVKPPVTYIQQAAYRFINIPNNAIYIRRIYSTVIILET